MDLLAEVFETTLKGDSKNAYGRSAWVVRFYRVLERIRIVYMRLYHLGAAHSYPGRGASGSSAVVSGSSASVSGAAVSGSSAAMSSGASIGVSASVEKASVSSSAGAVVASKTESASAGVMSATSAVHGEESAAAMVAAGAAAMSILYARYAREGTSVESTTFSADINAAAQEVQRVCTVAASDEAALASLLLPNTVEER